MFGFGLQIEIDKINKEIEHGSALLVDVRSDEEWEFSHAKGSTLFSLDRIGQGEAPTKDVNKKIYVYCASGARSGMAERILRQQGYNVENIGGLGDWRSAGGSIE